MDRIIKFDNSKFILIFLVVFGHCLYPFLGDLSNARMLYMFIYLFHMPAFVFLSGIFSKNSVNNKKYSSIFYLLFWFYIMKVIGYIANYITYKESTFSLFSEASVPWYLFALTAWILVTILLKPINPKYVLTISILLSCVAGYFEAINNFLVLSRIIVFYPFFYFGYILNGNRVAEFLDRKQVKTFSAVVIALAFLLCINNIDKFDVVRSFITGQNPFREVFVTHGYANLYPFGSAFRLIYYPITLILLSSIISIAPSTYSKISLWGQRTLQVYVLHYFIHIYIGCAAIKSFILKQPCPITVLFILSIIITIFLSNKYFAKLFKRFNFSKKFVKITIKR